MQDELLGRACALAERLLTENPVAIPPKEFGLTGNQAKGFSIMDSYTLINQEAWWKLDREEDEAYLLLDSMKTKSEVLFDSMTLKDVGSPCFVRLDLNTSSWIRYSNRYSLEIIRHIIGFWLNARRAENGEKNACAI